MELAPAFDCGEWVLCWISSVIWNNLFTFKYTGCLDYSPKPVFFYTTGATRISRRIYRSGCSFLTADYLIALLLEFLS